MSVLLIVLLVIHFLSQKSHVDFLEGSTEGRAGEVIDDGIEHAVEVGKADSRVESHICITEILALTIPALQHPDGDTGDI